MGEALKKLAAVQAELNVPKNQFNKFGNYKYRNAEDIMQAAKPLCIKNGLLLNVTDSIEYIGERYYVKATARVMNVDDIHDIVEATASAREPESKKGMDESQITGASSSYARKYALGGLFALDDTKDADTNEFHEQTGAGKAPAKQAPELVCSNCGKHITGTAKASAEQIADYNFKQFGRVLCAGCGSAASKAAKAAKGEQQ